MFTLYTADDGYVVELLDGKTPRFFASVVVGIETTLQRIERDFYGWTEGQAVRYVGTLLCTFKDFKTLKTTHPELFI